MIKVCVLGLGYVGLPVALGISSKITTVGFDVSHKRINELKKKYDSNNEFKKKDFNKKKLKFTNKPKYLNSANIYIICVPTPVKKNNLPEGSKRVTNDPMEATYIGLKMWAQAVEQAGTTNVDAVRQAIGCQTVKSPSGFKITMDA